MPAAVVPDCCCDIGWDVSCTHSLTQFVLHAYTSLTVFLAWHEVCVKLMLFIDN